MIKFSIIIPFYRGKKYIKHLQEMVNNNTLVLNKYLKDVYVELLIVNDSPEISIDDNCQYDSFYYKVIKYKKNKGIHGARATGLMKSKGDFILFLDQDDEIDNQFLFKQYMLMQENDVVVANAWIEHKDLSKDLLYKSNMQYRKITILSVYIYTHNQIISPGQCLIRKECIPNEWLNFETQNNGSDDLLLWLMLLSSKIKFIVNKEPLYIHKYTGINLSEEENKMIESSIEISEYLETTNMLSNKQIKKLIKNRKFKYVWNNENSWVKMKLLIKNMDIFLYRLLWKALNYF